MPGIIKVRIVEARNLPIMDRSTTDAFVEVRFGQSVMKTEVFRKSLDPQWNSDWFKFEVDDEDLQDEPLQLRVLDHDTYSAHDAIGKVYISLNSLLAPRSTPSISGWFPIYDTMHGIRGELYVIVKVDFFADCTKFLRGSTSSGVQYFCTTGVPAGYKVLAFLGFIEELVVNDDPEYQWIDKIRSMRASNEARQLQFSKLTGELQRKIGSKAIDHGANAVLGYRQCFDLEGESGVVVRAVGTLVRLQRYVVGQGSQVSPFYDYASSPKSKSPPMSAPPVFVSRGPQYSNPLTAIPGSTHLHPAYNQPATSHAIGVEVSPPPKVSAPKEDETEPDVSTFKLSSSYESGAGDDSSDSKGTPSPYKILSSSVNAPLQGSRHTSESDISISPSVPAGSSASGSATKPRTIRRMHHQPSIDSMEYPFFSMRSFPPGFIIHLGGVVSASSVKLLDRIHNPDEPETRDAWWTELRTEVRSHARAIGCQAVIGYTESTSICDEVIILSACGTACVINLNFALNPNLAASQFQVPQSVLEAAHEDFSGLVIDWKPGEHNLHQSLHVDVNLANNATLSFPKLDGYSEESCYNCALCHIPYKASCLPFPVTISKCALCRKRKVPDILFTTIEPPTQLLIIGHGSLIQARICRQKKDTHGEASAREISEILPFVQYEIHKQLVAKLKLKGMNALFGLKVTICVGNKVLIAVATATAAFVAGLPAPAAPSVVFKDDSNMSEKSHAELQKWLTSTWTRNQKFFHLQLPDFLKSDGNSPNDSADDADDSGNDLDLSGAARESFILDVDDADDFDVVQVLLDFPVPSGYYVCNTEKMPGAAFFTTSLQTFTKVSKQAITSASSKSMHHILNSIFKSLFFKLRHMKPCSLCDLDFDIEMPDDDQIQISVTGICATILDSHHSNKMSKLPSSEILKDQLDKAALASATEQTVVNQQPSVELSPLSYVPTAKIDKYVGHLNFFIVRETTTLREEGGLSGFLHNFVMEVMAICRAHVAALGGNALVSYRMSELGVEHNLHKNQAQCIVNVYGDVAVLFPVDKEEQAAVYLLSRSTKPATCASHSSSSVKDSQADIIHSVSEPYVQIK